MVQRDPSPRGDKNGADINLALDALELAFTHDHINAFAIVSGDSDFIALVNKLKQYDKTVFVVGGKAFTSTILQKNCHEFISYESMLDDSRGQPRASRSIATSISRNASRAARPNSRSGSRSASATAAAAGRGSSNSAVRRRSICTGDAAGGARAAGAGAARSAAAARAAEIDHAAAGFELQRARLWRGIVHRLHREAAQGRSGQVTGGEGRYMISAQARRAGEDGASGRGAAGRCAMCWRIIVWRWKRASARIDLEEWVKAEAPDFDWKQYGFQEFNEFLNYAQDRFVVRVQADEPLD